VAYDQCDGEQKDEWGVFNDTDRDYLYRLGQKSSMITSTVFIVRMAYGIGETKCVPLAVIPQSDIRLVDENIVVVNTYDPKAEWSSSLGVYNFLTGEKLYEYADGITAGANYFGTWAQKAGYEGMIFICPLQKKSQEYEIVAAINPETAEVKKVHRHISFLQGWGWEEKDAPTSP
jgi:hypothetical protein